MIERCWYPILEARALRRKPLRIRRLGEDRVVWRDGHGQPVIHAAFCPHRGVGLDLGRVVDGELECPMHGFRFAADGRCTLAPCEGPEAHIPRGIRLAPAPIRERHGLLWLWHGPPQATYPDVPWFDDVAIPIEQSSQISYPLPYHYTRLVEMILDMHHLPFVHRTALPGLHPLVRDYEASVDGDRIRQRGRLCKPDGTTTMEYICDGLLPGLSLVQVTPKVQMIVAATPIDGERTWFWFRYYQRYTGLPGLRRLLPWLFLMYEWQVIQRQDWRIFDAMAPGALDDVPMRLVRADTAIAMYRKLRRQRLQATVDVPLAELAPAGD